MDSWEPSPTDPNLVDHPSKHDPISMLLHSPQSHFRAGGKPQCKVSKAFQMKSPSQLFPSDPQNLAHTSLMRRCSSLQVLQKTSLDFTFVLMTMFLYVFIDWIFSLGVLRRSSLKTGAMVERDSDYVKEGRGHLIPGELANLGQGLEKTLVVHKRNRHGDLRSVRLVLRATGRPCSGPKSVVL